MGLISKLGEIFSQGGQRAVVINGQPSLVSRQEFAGLERLAAQGMIQKGIGSDALVGTQGIGGQGVPAFWFARAVEGGSGAETLSMPFATSVWVQRAIKIISGPIAGVDLLFSSAGAKTSSKARKRKAVGSDDAGTLNLPEVSAWLRHPMRGFSWSDFVEASIGWLKMQECFWVLDDSTLVPFPGARTEFPPVVIARPDRMRAVIAGGQLTGWVFTPPSGRAVALLPEQVIQLRYPNPYDDFRGLGEYPSAANAAEADWLAGKFSRNLMANNGDLGGIVIAKSGVPSDPQREQIIMDLRAKRAAQLRGELRYTFMTGDIDIKDPKITSVDAGFLGQRAGNRAEIANAFGVPPSMFEQAASYSIGSASDYYRLISDTCIPTGKKFCDALGLLITKLTGQAVECEFDWDDHPVMQAVRRERFDTVAKLWSTGMPMKDISDVLGLDLPRFAGDDVGFVAISVTPIGQAQEPPPNPTTSPEFSEPTALASPVPPEVKALAGLLRAKMGSGVMQKAATKGRNAKLWEHHMRQRSGTVKQFEGKTSRLLNQYRAVALRKLQEHGASAKAMTAKAGPIEMIFDAARFGAELHASFRGIYDSALQSGADQVTGEVGADPWQFPPQKALEFITGRTTSVQGCGETVRSQLNTTLSEGYEAGEGMDDLMGRVRACFNNLLKHEVRRIAMTETGMTFNFSRHEAMSAAGIRYKSWLSSHGPTVRPTHMDAEERYESDPIPINEPFEVGGEQLMHPGDPDGSPENIINCQCIELAVKAPEGE